MLVTYKNTTISYRYGVKFSNDEQITRYKPLRNYTVFILYFYSNYICTVASSTENTHHVQSLRITNFVNIDL